MNGLSKKISDLKGKTHNVLQYANGKLAVASATVMVPIMTFAEEAGSSSTGGGGVVSYTAEDFAPLVGQLEHVVTPANALLIGGVSVGICFVPALVRHGGGRLVRNAWKAITRGKVSF